MTQYSLNPPVYSETAPNMAGVPGWVEDGNKGWRQLTPQEITDNETQSYINNLTGWAREAYDRFSSRNLVRVNPNAQEVWGEGGGYMTVNPTMEHFDTGTNQWWELDEGIYRQWAATEDAQAEVARLRAQMEERRQREFEGRVQSASNTLRRVSSERQILQGGRTPALNDTLIQTLATQAAQHTNAYFSQGTTGQPQQSLLGQPDYVARQQPPNRGNPLLQVTTSSLLSQAQTT